MFNLVKSVDSIIADFKVKIEQLAKAKEYHEKQSGDLKNEAASLLSEASAQEAEAARADRLLGRLSALID